MGKRRSASEVKGTGSLNTHLRRKQFQSIEVENAKMLKRLQERKSDYELHRFKKEWRKTKAVIKNITSYPLVIDQLAPRKSKKNYDISQLARLDDPDNFQLVKVKVIDTKKFIVTVKFSTNKMVIIGDLRAQK